MPNVDFSSKPGAAPVSEHAPKPVETPNTAVATTPSQNLSFRSDTPTLNEIILPRINIVQNVGTLKNSFSPGSIVYKQNTVLYTPPVIDRAAGVVKVPGTAPLIITVLGFRPTRYVEKVAGGKRGVLCTTEEQVRANGGTLDYNEWKLKKDQGMKRFEYMADAMIAIARPECVADDGIIFNYPVDGVKYALAIWSMKGTAYTKAAKAVFFTEYAIGCLQKCYPAFSFNVSTRPEQNEGNDYFSPVCLVNKRNSPEFLAWAQGVLGAPQRDAEAAE